MTKYDVPFCHRRRVVRSWQTLTCGYVRGQVVASEVAQTSFRDEDLIRSSVPCGNTGELEGD